MITKSDSGLSLISSGDSVAGRVCFVIDRLRAAGTESQLLLLIRELLASPIKPYLVLLDGNDCISRSLEPQGCDILRLGVKSLHHLSTIGAANRFRRFLLQNRIDIVQMHFPDSMYFAAPLARLAGVRHVVRTRRDLGYWMTRRDRVMSLFYNRLCTVSIANCQACRQALVDQEGAIPHTVHVLENGVDTSRYESCTERFGDHDQARVGMIANIRRVKAPEVFVGAACNLLQDIPAIRFEIAGSDDEGHIEKECHRCGIDGRVVVRGSVADVSSFLQGLDVAVLCSHSEGLPNVVLEYMAAGRAIVATRVGAVEEVIDDEVEGLLVPPADPMSLARAIRRLLEDRELACRLGAAAREKARHRFGVRAMADRYVRFYDELVRGGGRHPNRAPVV